MFSALEVYLREGEVERQELPSLVLGKLTPRCFELRRLLLDALLDEPGSFRHTIRHGGGSLQLAWVGVAHTTGVALWTRRDQIVAASVLINGLEEGRDHEAIRHLFEKENLPLAQALLCSMAAARWPLITTLHYTSRGRDDQGVTSASNALAVAYFGMFGLTAE